MARCAEARLVVLEEGCRTEAALTVFCDASETPVGELGNCIGGALRGIGTRSTLTLATALRVEGRVACTFGMEIEEAERALQDAAARVCAAWEKHDRRSDA